MKLEYSIGDKVVINKVTHMAYDDLKQRKPFETPCEPVEVYVVGIVRRQLGKYIPGSRVASWESDYDPPSFRVTGTIQLLQCRKSIRSKIIEVQPAHVTQHVLNVKHTSPLFTKAPLQDIGL